MCGIVGVWHLNKEPVHHQLLQRMTDCIRHRGPDDEGHLVENNLGLGSRRLSIIDLSPAGHMPMPNQDETVWLVYNGEVYNYQELAGPLSARGYQFHSKTDTEVVLHAYEAYGPDCLNYFNGMWAFAVWDRNRRQLFCAIDRFGIKPFHYYFDGQRFVFGSEIKSILLHPGVPKQVSPQAVYDYLALTHINYNDQTFFSGIKRLPPAHYLTLDAAGNLSVKRWWDLNFESKLDLTNRIKTIERFAELFRDSVRLRLRSDVPVGTCLSGGLDSSSIVTIANELMFGDNGGIDPELVGRQQKTFSACYDDARFDERPFIETILAKTGAEANYVFPNGRQLFEVDMPHLIWHQEEPFGSTSIYAQWNVMRRTAERGVKVLLDGQGGDELLAGYTKYPPFLLQELIRRGRADLFLREFYALRAIQKIGFSSLPAVAYLTLPRWLRSLVSDFGWWANHHAVDVLQDDFKQEFERHRRVLAGESQAKFQQSLAGKSYSDITAFVLPALLRYEDRNSMAFSIEARVPFLDYRLVEFVFSLPPDYRLYNGWSKWILRQAMMKILPEQVRWRRDKIGFATPQRLWLQTAQADIQEVFSDNRLRSSRFIKSRQVLARLDNYLAAPAMDLSEVWRWLNLELWMRRFEL
ncbi:MAG: asparagine synthase (glutamine-hydrolyzing) [Anaerolineae bacterium]|nr:asparagine synthase (glutamine-hydrolyzing) [Anaerolineae bacterium]